MVRQSLTIISLLEMSGSAQGNTVKLSCAAVAQPTAVRYAYRGNPANANLYNKDGLPAIPFRTDNKNP